MMEVTVETFDFNDLSFNEVWEVFVLEDENYINNGIYEDWIKESFSQFFNPKVSDELILDDEENMTWLIKNMDWDFTKENWARVQQFCSLAKRLLDNKKQ